MIQVNELAFAYHDKDIIESLSFSVEKGEIFGILGPNGSGKTTILKLIARTLQPTAGSILLGGEPLQSFTNKEFAKQVAVLPQLVDTTFSYNVIDIIKMGRYAHQTGFFSTWNDTDERIVQQVLEETALSQYSNKGLQQLSGGEQQRVFLARALAQQPELLLLDEPTNHLDISYQTSLFDGLVKWKREKKLTVIAIFHDLNLASLYCDRVLLLDQGEIVSIGTPQQVMQSAKLESVYHTKIVRNEHSEIAKPMISLIPKEIDHEESSLFNSITFQSTREHIVIQTDTALKTLSSALIGGGFNWSNTFVNRHVPIDYKCDNAQEEMEQYLLRIDVDPSNTVGMMTAVKLEDFTSKKEATKDGSVFVTVTAGTGNAIDSAHAYQHKFTEVLSGTINMFILIEAKLSEAAFVQLITTATEAKTKALVEENIIDPITKGLATGTSTDSICIAATQTKREYEYGGPLTPIGKLVGKLVYEATREAIVKYKQRKDLYNG